MNEKMYLDFVTNADYEDEENKFLIHGSLNEESSTIGLEFIQDQESALGPIWEELRYVIDIDSAISISIEVDNVIGTTTIRLCTHETGGEVCVELEELGINVYQS